LIAEVNDEGTKQNHVSLQVCFKGNTNPKIQCL